MSKSIAVLLIFAAAIATVIAVAFAYSLKSNAPTNTHVSSPQLLPGSQRVSQNEMSLVRTGWQWQKTILTNGTSIVPRNPSLENFVLIFREKRVTSSTDCNLINGFYKTNGRKISMSLMITERGCGDILFENLQERDYLDWLGNAESFDISGETLSLTLKNGGVMTFQKVKRDFSNFRDFSNNPGEVVSTAYPTR